MLTGSIQKAPAGARGFDANTVISSQAAAAFYEAGFRFCLRYVGRTQMASYDLTTQEAETILAAGLALMPVQHVLNPGWKATVDGRPATIERVDYLLRGVVVPPGRHRVEFRYQPASWRAGWIISLLAILILVATTVVAWRRRPRPG